jgi:hypothetical protein
MFAFHVAQALELLKHQWGARIAELEEQVSTDLAAQAELEAELTSAQAGRCEAEAQVEEVQAMLIDVNADLQVSWLSSVSKSKHVSHCDMSACP